MIKLPIVLKYNKNLESIGDIDKHEQKGIGF